MKFYTNYHLALSKKDYQSGCVKGLYNEERDNLSCLSVAPAYEKFNQLLRKYGGKWNWDKRPRYYKDRLGIQRRLRDEETRLYLFYKGKKEIGYCLVTAPKKFRADPEEGRHIIEIENIALDVAETGNGYGRYFLQEIFACLFMDYETVYLTSRSTNHSGVVPFYQKMGMSVIHIEKNQPCDLIFEERIVA